MKTFADIEKGGGEWAVLDLPVPLEPVIVDLNRPMEDQLPKGPYLDAAKKMLETIKETV